MAPAPQWVTDEFLKDIIELAIDHQISISDDKIIDYISKKRNHSVGGSFAATWALKTGFLGQTADAGITPYSQKASVALVWRGVCIAAVAGGLEAPHLAA